MKYIGLRLMEMAHPEKSGKRAKDGVSEDSVFTKAVNYCAFQLELYGKASPEAVRVRQMSVIERFIRVVVLVIWVKPRNNTSDPLVVDFYVRRALSIIRRSTGRLKEDFRKASTEHDRGKVKVGNGTFLIRAGHGQPVARCH